MAQHGEAHHLVPALALGEPDAADTGTVATGEHADIVLGGLEADAAAGAGGEEDIVALAQSGDADQVIALVEFHGDEAGGAHVAEIR